MSTRAHVNVPVLGCALAVVSWMTYRAEFNAVFSNAALQWVREADAAAAAIAHALKPGGRFVAEFGGKGNIQALAEAIFRALDSLGVQETEQVYPWFFPSIGEYV